MFLAELELECVIGKSLVVKLIVRCYKAVKSSCNLDTSYLPA